MARLKKNGNLSGAIGNIVFVNDGDRSYVRALGKKPKQTKNTKEEAKKFGLVGAKEKLYRDLLKEKIGLVTYQYQAVRHATKLRKTISKVIDDNGNFTYRFQDPQALVGFDLNPKMEWERCTNFYPKYELITDGTMSVSIPALTWSEQVIAPKNASRATLTLYALSTDLDKNNVDVIVVSSLPLVLGERDKLPAQEWVFDIPKDTKWLIIIGMLDFESNRRLLEKTEKILGAYLWARSIEK